MSRLDTVMGETYELLLPGTSLDALAERIVDQINKSKAAFGLVADFTVNELVEAIMSEPDKYGNGSAVRLHHYLSSMCGIDLVHPESLQRSGIELLASLCDRPSFRFNCEVYSEILDVTAFHRKLDLFKGLVEGRIVVLEWSADNVQRQDPDLDPIYNELFEQEDEAIRPDRVVILDFELGNEEVTPRYLPREEIDKVFDGVDNVKQSLQEELDRLSKEISPAQKKIQEIQEKLYGGGSTTRVDTLANSLFTNRQEKE